MKKLLVLLIALSPLFSMAQEAKKTDFGIKFSGFVKNDAFWDTRQTVAAREGHFLLYPANEVLDMEGNDINEGLNFNMLSIQTRLTGKITGPDAFGAKTSGVIEGAFFGHSNLDVNGFRLRHAFAKFDWGKTKFTAGQTWHPFFITACFPGTISFNTGVPFQPFSRNPQLRVEHTEGPITLLAAATSQRDFASPGGSSDLRNSGIPDMHLQMHIKPIDQLIFGGGVGYKVLKPRLMTDSSYKTEKTVEGLSAIGFAKVTTKPITFKIEGVYGQNLFDLLMLGGYAYDFTEDAKMVERGDYDYTTLNNMSFWTDIHTNGKKMQVGLFAGYTQNLGSNNNMLEWTLASNNTMFARGSNIDYVYRLSPRFHINSGKARFALETEYTTAVYGNTINSLGEIQEQSTDFPNAETTEVSNLRLLFSVFYFF